jgi:hypothetical protein
MMHGQKNIKLKKRGTEFGPAVISGLLSIAFRAVYRLRLDWLK